jgi:exosome complex RNA-binding protein Csl4
MSIQTINAEILQGAFTIEQLDSINDAVKFARSRIAQANAFTLRAGAKITINHPKLGGTVGGTVLKVKIKKADVKLNNGFIYTVPLSMLTAV